MPGETAKEVRQSPKQPKFRAKEKEVGEGCRREIEAEIEKE
jgi:hypothetical protein